LREESITLSNTSPNVYCKIVANAEERSKPKSTQNRSNEDINSNVFIKQYTKLNITNPYTSHHIQGVPPRTEIPVQARLKKETSTRYEELHSLYENGSEVDTA
jgi:hypothetical protein